MLTINYYQVLLYVNCIELIRTPLFNLSDTFDHKKKIILNNQRLFP